MTLRMAFDRLLAITLLCVAPGRAVQSPAQAAEAHLPVPSQAFTPRSVLAIYADLQGASKSAVWKAIGDKAGPLVEQLQALQQSRKSSFIPGIHQTNVAEIALVLEGDKVLSDLQSNQFDPNSGFLAVIRLTPAQEVEKLIHQLMEAIDVEKPGTRGQIEKSRRRVGIAEWFDLPADVLAGERLPFAMSCAIGPGQDGTIIGLGRSENLRAFLSGKTEGKLRGQVNETLSRRSQVWFHLTVPREAAKNLGAGGPNANPMLAGLAQSMEKVRDASISLNFAANQIDVELDLGCEDAAAAAQLAQGMQGLLGMAQLGARQNPESMPPFIGKARVVSEAASFRLTTAISVRDIELALQKAGRGLPGPRQPASAESPKPEPVAPAAPQPPLVEVEFVQFSSEDQESLRPAKMRVLNRSSQPVKELKLTFTYVDGSGRKLGQWTRTHPSLTAQNLVDGGATQVVACLAFNVPNLTKKVTVTLHEVTFANSEKWSPPP